MQRKENDKQTDFEIEELRQEVERLKNAAEEKDKVITALREPEVVYRSVFEKANVGFILGQDGQTEIVNSKALEILGFTEGELKAKVPADIVHPDDLENFLENWKTVYELGHSIQQEHRVITNNGQVKWHETLVSAISWNDKPASLTIFSDITRRKKAEEELRESELRYRSVIEHTNAGISITRDDKRLYFNSRMHDMLGYTKEEYENLPFMSVFHPDDKELSLKRIRERIGGEDGELPPPSFTIYHQVR